MSARIVLRSGKVIDTTESVGGVYRALGQPDGAAPGSVFAWIATPDGPALIAVKAVDAVVPLGGAG